MKDEKFPKLKVKRSKRRFLNRLFASMIPRYGQRAFFLTTLFVHVSKISREHRLLLEEMNTKFCIFGNCDATEFVSSFHKAVWSGCELDTERASSLTQADIETMASEIIDAMPEWAMYDNRSRVQEETMGVLRHGLSVNRSAEAVVV